MTFIDRLNDLLRKKPKPDAPQPIPPAQAPKYLQAWLLLKKIPVEKLFPAVTSVSAVIFFAISGLLAWLVVVCAFVVRLFKIVL